MPPKNKFTREQITQTALSIIRRDGIDAVTARSVGSALNSSPKVIFGHFQNMKELLQESISAAEALYESYLREDMERGEYPPYKASGIAYIRFAREEKELFKLLFMRDRSHEVIEESMPEPIIKLIEQNTGFGREEALKFHLEMWIFVHGIATMVATDYLSFSEEAISQMLTDLYQKMRKS